MTLNDYLKVNKATEIAKGLGLYPQVISHWKNGIRPVPVEHCANIERISGYQVMRWDLRPNDWWEIWPELLQRPDAPKLKAA